MLPLHDCCVTKSFALERSLSLRRTCMQAKITETLAKNLAQNTTCWDQQITGLALRRQTKTPVFILRNAGRQIVLGKYPVMTVEMARAAALATLRQPITQALGSRFADVVDRYLAAGSWRLKSRVEIERYLLGDARALADRPLV